LSHTAVVLEVVDVQATHDVQESKAFAVGGERDFPDDGITGDREAFLAGPGVPEANGEVASAGGERRAVAGEGEAIHLAGVSEQGEPACLHQLPVVVPGDFAQ